MKEAFWPDWEDRLLGASTEGAHGNDKASSSVSGSTSEESTSKTNNGSPNGVSASNSGGVPVETSESGGASN